jgi:two-component system, chemotaxis family, protein-glutamate methylesterase/glutaminase
MTPDANGRPAPRRTRVLVVDDSATQRAILVALLGGDPGLEVAGWAANGEEAVRAAARLKPDVITMDLRMPVMDGLEATRRIMHATPIPIVMVTSSASDDDRKMAFAALDAGVLAFVSKPTPATAGRLSADELVRTVKSMAEVKVIRRWSPERLQRGGVAAAGVPVAAPALGRPAAIVAIGASTGGPQALHEILTRLPATFPLPVLVVQHIAEGFAPGLIDWLRPLCALPIQLATPGAVLDHPGIHVSPTGRHLVVRGRTVALSAEEPVSGHRPSATVLFRAVAEQHAAAAIGVLLSGMGDDGAAGLRDLKRAGGLTIAQDEASSVVFGMPAVAISMGIVDHVLPPSAIAGLLVQLAARAARG